MAAKPLPSQEILRQLLDYDPETGKLFWKERPDFMFASLGAFKSWNTKFSGKEAFTTIGSKGYRTGRIFNSHYLAQRVIWKLVKGVEPVEVDHEDGNRLNNKFTNLKDVDSVGNKRNSRLRSDNTSGVAGVDWHAATGKWRARVKVTGRFLELGECQDKNDAIAARRLANKKYGFSKRHGKA